jgi:cytochrome c553
MKSLTLVPSILLVLLLVSQMPAKAGVEDSAAICAGCHGEEGVPTDKKFPVIWGQNQEYLLKQLGDFKSGARKNEMMTDIAAALDDQTMLDLSTYFAAKRSPSLVKP